MVASTHADLTRTCGSAGSRVQELPASRDVWAGLEVGEWKVGDLGGVIVDFELVETLCHSSSDGRSGERESEKETRAKFQKKIKRRPGYQVKGLEDMSYRK